MDTVWVGIKLSFGLALGFALLYVVFRVFRQIRGFLFNLRFVHAGCTYQSGERPGAPCGWVTRDISNDDWVLWDVDGAVALRCSEDDPPGASWRVSNETLRQFLTLARSYEEFWEKPLEERQGIAEKRG